MAVTAVLGRPSIFTEELALRICERIVDGDSVRSICAQDGMPGLTTLFRWLESNEVFREQYRVAREIQADVLFDEIRDIADDTSHDTIATEDGDRPNTEWIARSKLRVHAREFQVMKLRPKVYGDHATTDVNMSFSGSVDVQLNGLKDDELRAVMAKQMLALGMQQPGTNNQIIDVVATEVQVEDVVDLVELNKSLGDIDQKPAKQAAPPKPKVMK